MDQDRLGRLTGTAAAPVHATSTAGGAQRDPEGTSRKPRRRHGHRRGFSLPTTPYQNAARMFRGARRRGQTERPGAVIRPGWLPEKRRVGAVRGAVSAQSEPKRDRPRAQTPMNRRKSPLRRRAAPVAVGGRAATRARVPGERGSGVGGRAVRGARGSAAPLGRPPRLRRLSGDACPPPAATRWWSARGGAACARGRRRGRHPAQA